MDFGGHCWGFCRGDFEELPCEFSQYWGWLGIFVSRHPVICGHAVFSFYKVLLYFAFREATEKSL